ncbi:hypothetical protein WJX82_001204 [Trebouxia sp. C0006]
MPPVLDALQAIFPDITSPVASVVDEPVVIAGATEQGNLQSVEDGNKSYSSRMAAINSKYSAAVDNFSHQQQYLLSQQEQAQKADEDALIQADSAYTPGWRKAGLPVKGSHLLLDPLQVQQAGLENPQSVLQQYGAHNLKEVLSPLRFTDQNQAGADPHYCSLTSNLQARSKLVPAKRRAEAGQGTTWRALAQDDLKARLAASSVRRKAMSHTMPKDQWDLEKKIINNMHHKLTFLRNPRFPSPEKHIRGALPDHPPAAPAKPLGSSRSGSPSKGTRAGLPHGAFRAEPGQVLFRDCEVGQTYQQLVKLRNCTPIGQRLRLIPSSTPFLSFSSLVYTSEAPEPGLVAPGMHVGVTITFTPNSLHNVDDVMVVETGQGSLQVPLLVRRDPPALTLPHQILIGPTLVSNKQVVSITCTNNGGPGQFSIIGQGQDPACPEQDKGIRLGPFEVSPADFALDRGEAVQLSIAFSPAVAGGHSESFVVLCDNGTSTAHQLSGKGSEVCVQLHSLEGRQLSEAERRQAIWFGDVVVGARQQRVVRLLNTTPLPLPFCWQQTDEPVAEGSQHAQHEMTDGRFGAMQFHVEPAVGILEAGAAADIALAFCPDSQHRFLSWAQLLVDTSVPGSSIVPKYSKRVLEIALEGIGAACSVLVWPPIIRCPAILELGQVIKQELTVSNPGQAAAHVAWSCAHLAVALLPRHAAVAAGSEQQFEVVVTGREIGRIQAELVCSVEHGAAQAVEVMAAVAGPRVEFEDPGLLFGLVQLGTQVCQQITIRNPSSYSSASWTLRELPQHSSSTPSTDSASTEQPSSSSSTVDAVNLKDGAQRAQQGVTDASGNSHLSVVGFIAGDEVEANQGMLSNPFEVAARTAEEEGGAVRVQLQPDWGLLAPGASTTIQVLMDATAEGVFNTTLELFTKGGSTAYLSCTAAIIAPSLAMTPTHLDLGGTHLGVPRVCSLTLSNLTMLPTSFAWEAYGSGGVGVMGGEMSVVVDPVQGLLEPGQQLPIQATFMPTAIGPAEALVACCTDGPNPPAGFSTVSHVRGLSITYNIQTAPLLDPLFPHIGPGKPMDIGSDSRRTASPAGLSHRSQHAMAALTLSEEAERSRPFASALGQLMMTQRATEAAAKQVVGGKGMAMRLTPSHGLLPPGGSFTCTVSCTTDMCGDYTDILHVQVGDLPVKKIPVHAPTEEVPAGLVLDFGQLVADSPAEHAFHVFNTSALPVRLSWTFYRYGLPGPIESRQASHPSASIGHPPRPPAQPVRVVAVHWAVDNAAETVSLSTTILANPAEQPFRTEPSTAVIAGNGSAKFTVSLSTPDAMLHTGYLLGTQQIVAPESRVALHCSVTEGDNSDRPDEAKEETQERSRVGSEEGASQGADGLPGGVSSGSQEVVLLHGRTQTVAEAEQPLVVCQISGGFHPHAGRPAAPLQPLRVDLNANVIQPKLEAELSFAQSGQLAAGPFQAALLLGKGMSIEKASAQQNSDASMPFTVAPSSGVLLGRSLTLPKKQMLLVMFAPKQVGLCSAELSVLVAHGQTVKVGLSGQGTYVEADETAARL